MSNPLTFLQQDQIQVGDTVGIVRWISVSYGRHYKHPFVEKAVVTKISPKRKSFTINGATFSDRDVTGCIAAYNEVAIAENELAEKYKKCRDLKYKIESAKDKYGYLLLRLDDLDEGDLDKVLDLLTYLEGKYLKA